MLLNLLLLSFPQEEWPPGMLEELLPKRRWRSEFGQHSGGASGGEHEYSLLEKIVVPAAGNAVSRQPTTLSSFRVFLQKAALIKVMAFVMHLTSSGWWLHGHKSPTTLAKCWTTLKGYMRTRFHHGIGQGFFGPAIHFDFSLCSILLSSRSFWNK